MGSRGVMLINSSCSAAQFSELTKMLPLPKASKASLVAKSELPKDRKSTALFRSNGFAWCDVDQLVLFRRPVQRVDEDVAIAEGIESLVGGEERVAERSEEHGPLPI